MIRDDIQAQNVPINIKVDDPQALRQLVDVAKQQVIRISELEQRIIVLEDIVHGD